EETPQRNYAQRTEWNVRDSDGTLILCRGTPSGGTAQTIEIATVMHKPLLVVNLDEETDIVAIHLWLKQHDIRVLNIAGPRESQAAGIYRDARALLNKLLDDC
ncbi:MAG: putative molybdenum carrier protein, partial [Mariprofundaceae bacterium]|nr:putative molybdenum carrier protein [Mariprofundaceae bacterium]